MAAHRLHDPSGRDRPLSNPNRRSFLLATVSTAATPVLARARNADVLRAPEARLTARANDRPFASLPNSQRQLRPHEDTPHRYSGGGV
jgi:hypothetical protein